MKTVLICSTLILALAAEFVKGQDSQILADFMEIFAGKYNKTVRHYPNGTTLDWHYSADIRPVRVDNLEGLSQTLLLYDEKEHHARKRASLLALSITNSRIKMKWYNFTTEAAFPSHDATIDRNYFRNRLTSWNMLSNDPRCDISVTKNMNKVDTYNGIYPACTINFPPRFNMTIIFNCTGFYVTPPTNIVFATKKQRSPELWPPTFDTYRKPTKPCSNTK